ncbi:LPXTG cell wall anchor domain-containing protein [Aerococcus christensenii]|uniref:LPXTG cell wall anchor domain-containing protein n=1 Tax=Aerococcus christensenii TaxID=87541 RepID=UPI002549F236|nr:DUF5633 domain-containing protein [Aerococcus christensenii]MDK8234024.1 DUF5633 domain-containing protein [Aerococcus christensenii]
MTKNLKKLLLAATATTAAAGVFFASEATVASAAEGTNTAATAPKTRAESAAIVTALQPRVTNVKTAKEAIATKEAAVKEAEKAVQADPDKDDKIALKKAEIATFKVTRDQLQAKEDKAKAEYDAKLAKYNTQKASLAAEKTAQEAKKDAATKEVAAIKATEEYKAYDTANQAAAQDPDKLTVVKEKYADVISKFGDAQKKVSDAEAEINAIEEAENKLTKPADHQEIQGLAAAKKDVEDAEKELANLEAYGQEKVDDVDKAKKDLEDAKTAYDTALLLLKATIKAQKVDAKTTLIDEDSQAVLTDALQLAGAQESEKPDDKKPEGEKPDDKKPEGEKPDDKKPEGEKPEGEKPEGEKPEGEKPEGEKPEGEKPAAEENNETGFHFVVDAEQAAEDALLKNDGINKGYKIARHEYKDADGKVTDVRYFYTLTIEEGKEKGRFEDNTQGFASKANAVKAAEAALKVDHEINTGYEVNFNKRMGRYFYKLTMDGKKVVPAAKVEEKKAEEKKAEEKKAEEKKAEDKKAADKKAADKKAAAKKAAKKKALPKTGAIAGSVALMGLALASTGSVFAFRRRK